MKSDQISEQCRPIDCAVNELISFAIFYSAGLNKYRNKLTQAKITCWAGKLDKKSAMCVTYLSLQ